MNAGREVSIVVCVRNTVELLRKNLGQIKQAVPEAELIVVDGNSTDGSRDIASRYADRVVSDEGKGLAYARQLGINTSTRPYVSFVGPDNRVTKELLYAMQDALERDATLAAVAPQTLVMDARSYWEKTTKYFFAYVINRPGLVGTVGTPCMYKREIVSRIQYDPQIRAAGDDTDLSLRLRQAGYTLRVIDAYTEERNELDQNAFVARWRWYGRGDAEVFEKYKHAWNFPRRLASLTHPFRKYCLWAAWLFLIHGVPHYIPGLYVAVWARYAGWWQRARELKKT